MMVKDPYDGGGATRDDFEDAVGDGITKGAVWLVTNRAEDGEEYSAHWVVLGSKQDAWATVHFYLQDEGCQVCDVVEAKHADGSIDPFPHPFETNDTSDEIDNWLVKEITITQRKLG